MLNISMRDGNKNMLLVGVSRPGESHFTIPGNRLMRTDEGWPLRWLAVAGASLFARGGSSPGKVRAAGIRSCGMRPGWHRQASRRHPQRDPRPGLALSWWTGLIMENLHPGKRRGGVVDVLVEGNAAPVSLDRIGRDLDTGSRAGRTHLRDLGEAFLHAHQAMGGHPEPVTEDLMISVHPGMGQEVIERFAEVLASPPSGLAVVVVILPAGPGEKLPGIHQRAGDQEVEVRRVDHQVAPVILGEGPLVTIFPRLNSPGFHPVPERWVQTVRVCNREGGLDAQDTGHLHGLIVKPGEGLRAPVRVGADARRRGEVHVPEIALCVVHSLVSLDSLRRLLRGPGSPGGGTGGACWPMAAMPDRARVVAWVLRARDQEADLATCRIRFSIAWREFYRRWNVEWLYIRIPRLSQGPVEILEPQRANDSGGPRRGLAPAEGGNARWSPPGASPAPLLGGGGA